MAFFQCSIFSGSLGKNVSVNILLPQEVDSQFGTSIKGENNKKYPVLYLLHGYSDDHSAWMRRSAIERYVDDKKLIVVMPDGGKSFYRNYGSNDNYRDFIALELPRFLERYLPANTSRESSYIAGLSMGGYGALAIGLEYLNNYRKICAMSSVADIVEAFTMECFVKQKIQLFGDIELKNSEHDLFYLLSKNNNSPIKPKLELSCGTEDFLYHQNAKLINHLKSLNYEFTYDERPGTHNWEFWDESIKNFLANIHN